MTISSGQDEKGSVSSDEVKACAVPWKSACTLGGKWMPELGTLDRAHGLTERGPGG